ncbi:hypothetical protein [Metamycoplasma neophronis]|uniref:Uncharacterized protein n=1 Tax=Metamycoplasma neophronis TaxID=872983 RepID=A0ABY2YZR7_9BACT|nr:hypothetical protein [Metamycoplasma neophronis]TPR53876.1 hypothetical protein FJR74_01790 [Metamycoplasma neophronis]
MQQNENKKKPQKNLKPLFYFFDFIICIIGAVSLYWLLKKIFVPNLDNFLYLLFIPLLLSIGWVIYRFFGKRSAIDVSQTLLAQKRYDELLFVELEAKNNAKKINKDEKPKTISNLSFTVTFFFFLILFLFSAVLSAVLFRVPKENKGLGFVLLIVSWIFTLILFIVSFILARKIKKAYLYAKDKVFINNKDTLTDKSYFLLTFENIVSQNKLKYAIDKKENSWNSWFTNEDFLFFENQADPYVNVTFKSNLSEKIKVLLQFIVGTKSINVTDNEISVVYNKNNVRYSELLVLLINSKDEINNIETNDYFFYSFLKSKHFDNSDILSLKNALPWQKQV